MLVTVWQGCQVFPGYVRLGQVGKFRPGKATLAEVKPSYARLCQISTG